MKKILILLTIAFYAATAQAHQIKTNSAVYPTTAATWKFDEKPQIQLEQINASTTLPLQDIHLSLIDGQTNKVISLSAPQIQESKSTFIAAQSAGDLEIIQELKPSSQNNTVLWKITVRNNGDKESWLEMGLAGELQTTEKLKFWDGYSFQNVGDKVIERHTPSFTFPATMIQTDSAQDALVIALQPDNDISWASTSLDPQAKKYFLGGRFVIPAKQKIIVKYALFTLRPQFGELDAIQGYYQRFAQSFVAQPNTDPRLTGFRGVNATYRARYMISAENGDKAVNPKTFAQLGRVHAGWDWGYTSYKFSGDWFGRAPYWNLALSEGDQAALDAWNKGRSSFDLHDLEKFHRDRIALYKNADLRGNIEMSFYLLNFAQTELAKKAGWMKYAYGYMTHDNLASGRIKHWATTYGDEWHLFPWATPFGDSYKRDLPDILKELNTSSIAVDLYSDTSPYRGETTEYIPGWSYDSKGKYINTALANKRLVQFMHTLHGNGFAGSAVVNSSPWQNDPALKTASGGRIPPFSSIFAADAYIVEGDASQQVSYDQEGRLFPKRYLYGKKYISSVSGAYRDEIGERIPWRTMSNNQIRKAYSRYLKKRVMAYYQGGLLPNLDDARGIAPITNEIPRLLEIESRGFEATPASVGNATLQRRRYGGEIGAAIVYSNPTLHDIADQETLLNAYFSDNQNAILLPFEDSGKKVLFDAKQETSFSLSTPSMGNSVIVLPISLQLDNRQIIHGETQADLQAHQQTFTANVTLEKPSKVLLRVQPPRDFALQQISINGNQISDITSGHSAITSRHSREGGNPEVREAAQSISVSLNAGSNQIVVQFSSSQFLSSEKQLHDFDWKQIQIVSLGTSERVQAAAQIISDNAVYYHKATPVITTKSTFDVASATTPTVVVATDANHRGVQIDRANPNVLFVRGANDFDTQQLAWRLWRLLDHHSPLIPAASFTNKSTVAMLDKIDIMASATVAKPITFDALKPVAGDDEMPAGGTADLSQLDFSEIEPLPRDGWNATASAIYTRDKTVSLEAALDGIAGTRWTGGRGKAGAWFMVDMGKEQEFNHLQFKNAYPYKYHPRHFKVEISDDGVNWRSTLTEQEPDDEEIEVTDIFWPAMQKARYIRITLTKDQNAFWSIDEVLVYKRALAQKISTATPLDELPHLVIPLINATISIDGKLDDTAWQKAAVINNFSSLKGDKPLSQSTQVQIFHDGKNLYLGIVAHEANMDKLWDSIQKRDGEVWGGDDIEIYLSPGDHEGKLKFPYYQFLFSPSGVQTDLKVDDKGKTNIKWDADWKVKTHKDADKWTAEVAIPLAALNGENIKIWRANIGRQEKPNGDTSTWAPMKRIFAQPDLFGVWTMAGIQD